MSHVLVPTRVAAWQVDEPEAILRELADFTLLPHVDTGAPRPHEVNSDIPFLSDAVATHPFDLESIPIPPGVHLHWALPDALVRARAPKTKGPPATSGAPDFSPIPNRWLVIRRGGDLPGKSWIVESDFVHPESEVEAHAGFPPITFPLRDPSGSRRPFVFLGRQRELDELAGRESPPEESCLARVDGHPLMAPGWGDPHFHAFYPTCRSVLGLYDPEPRGRRLPGLEYSVFGFYEGTTRDGDALEPLTEIVARFDAMSDAELRHAEGLSADHEVEAVDRTRAFATMLRRELGWRIDESEVSWFDEPERRGISGAGAAGSALRGIVCAGRVTVTTEPSLPGPDIELAVGSTATEALSAFLAPRLAGRLARDGSVETPGRLVEAVENQLEALHLSADLQHHRVDLGPKFEEARLQQSFEATSGGALWTLRAESDSTDPVAEAPAQAAPVDPGAALAIARWSEEINGLLAHDLHLLNRLQTAYDRARRVMDSLRDQVFLDWSFYMTCAYRPPHAVRRDDTDSMDVVARLVEAHVAWLRVVERFTGEISVAPVRPAIRGEVSVARDSAKVRGLGTRFTEELKPGDVAWIADERVVVAEILGDDQLSLAAPHLAGTSADRLLRDVTFWRQSAVSPPIADTNPGPEVLRIVEAELRRRAGDPEVGEFDDEVDFADWYARYVGREEDLPLDFVLENLIDELVPRGGGDPVADSDGPFVDLATATVRIQDRVANRLSALGELHHRLLHTSSREAIDEQVRAVVEVFGELEATDELTLTLGSLPPEALASANKRLARELGRHQLRRTAAPRFWRPREPNLLIVGEGLEDTGRHGEDGELECGIIDADPLTDLESMTREVQQREELVPHEKTDSDGPHPLFVEWEIAVRPAAVGGNVDPRRRRFASSFVLDNYDVDDSRREELSFGEEADTTPSTTVIAGRSVLTPHSRELLAVSLDEFLLTQTHAYLVSETPEDSPLGEGHDGGKLRSLLLEYFERHAGEIEAWCREQHELDMVATYVETPALPDADLEDLERRRREILDELPDDRSRWREYLFGEHELDVLAWFGPDADRRAPLEFAALARRELPGEGALQSVTLSGFNDALLMRRQGFQLPISDPLGFPNNRDFTEVLVRNAVLDRGRVSVVPGADFMPLRTGEARLLRIRIADTYGRFILDRNLPADRADARIAVPARKKAARFDFSLPLRITQAARLNFRWLSAKDGDQEANAHPFSSPVCGWVVPRVLDASLEFYDAAGLPLGSIDQEGRWRLAPGDVGVSAPRLIPSSELAAVARWILDRAAEDTNLEFIPRLVDDLERSLENADPEDFAHHESVALLMGRPMAVVRAVASVELATRPAEHQGALAMHRRLRGALDRTDGFLDVEFPIQVGKPGQLGDGLIGYWLEEDDGALERELRLPNRGSTAAGRFQWFSLQLRQPPRAMTILMDPRGSVHIKTGVLPTKSISIPDEHFAETLSRLQVHFPSAPLLTGRSSVDVPLPRSSEYTWSWMQREGAGWREVAAVPVVTREEIEREFATLRRPFDRLVELGWLRPVEDRAGHATLTPINERQDIVDGPLAPVSQDLADALNRMSTSITEPETGASFEGGAEIREGWLMLRPNVAPEEKDEDGVNDS